MGNRLSKIVTRTGDDGTTGLGDGQRLAKNSRRVEAMGSVDETNSLLGLVCAELDLSHAESRQMAEALQKMQNDLFDLGGELAMPGFQLISDNHIERLENWVEEFNADLPPLKNFILPGGSKAASYCHLARSVCRRAERVVVGLGHEDAINQELQRYLNRLSDLLFVFARRIARLNGGEEILWEKTEWPESGGTEG